MANRVPPPPREFNWGRMLRTLSFWALLIVGSIALVQFASNRGQEAAEISYTAFTEELDRDNVASVEITERQQVKGQFRRPVPVGRQNAERFTTLLPFESSDTWIASAGTRSANRFTRCGSTIRITKVADANTPSMVPITDADSPIECPYTGR